MIAPYAAGRACGKGSVDLVHIILVPSFVLVALCVAGCSRPYKAPLDPVALGIVPPDNTPVRPEELGGPRLRLVETKLAEADQVAARLEGLLTQAEGLDASKRDEALAIRQRFAGKRTAYKREYDRLKAQGGVLLEMARTGLIKRCQNEAARRAEVPVALNIDLGDGVTMKMVLIPAGTFIMGSPSTEKGSERDETQHVVTITKPFYISVTEVTQAQYERVIGENPSRFNGRDRPVDRLSWEDAAAFCRSLTLVERQTGRLRDGEVYCLPTEAQWEYACRAGTTTTFNTGDTISADEANFKPPRTFWLPLPFLGLYEGEYRRQTVPVGSFDPNAWGLYDMHGNAWEWCGDWYGPYATGRVADPTGPVDGRLRLLRGGSFYSREPFCRAADRYAQSPSTRAYNGFRCVRTVVAP